VTDVAGAVRSVVRVAVATAGQAGRASAEALGEAVEAPARALARRVTARAVAQPAPVADRATLAEALARPARGPALGGTTAAALAARVARRIGPLRFLARRAPMWLVVSAGPALHASISRGADELGLVASHLVLRARQAGVQVEPELVRRAAVQVLAGAPVDPEAEPHHARLALEWIARAARSALPRSAGLAPPDPDAIAAAAAGVAPSSLGSGTAEA